MNEKEQMLCLKGIVANFEKTVEELKSIALSCPKGGNENWYNHIKKYNVESASEKQKQAYYSSGMPVTKGALPTELRKVLKVIRYETIKSFRFKFENIELSFDAEMYWDNFTDRLRDFIENEINTYIGEIKQEVNISNIFANAFSGMNKYSGGLTESRLDTKKCNSCGSPRLDEDQYGECYFCGTPLFETAKIEAKCKVCGSPKFLEDQGKVCQYCGN